MAIDSTATLQQSSATNTTRQQPSLSTLVDMEMYKLRKRPMTLVVSGLMLAALTIFVGLSYVISRANDNGAEDLNGFLLPEIMPNAFDVIGGLGSILLVV